MKNKIKMMGMLALMLTAVTLARADFDDVASNHANHEAINYVQNQKIVEGYADGSYRPDQTINRVEFLKIAVGAGLKYTPEQDPSAFDIYSLSGVAFTDVEAGAWYVPYLRRAVESGVIQGYPDGTFRPAEPISFVEAAKVITTSFGYEIGPGEVWYKPYVESIGQRRAIPISIDRFDKQITRGEMAEMIYRLQADIRTQPFSTYRLIDETVNPVQNTLSSRPISITDGQKHSIPLESILGGGPPKDGIPSIDEPEFIGVEEADQIYDDEGLGISVSLNGVHRFYPNQVLVWHEIVNDDFLGQPVLVTYCPLCGTGIVFDPRVNGVASEFGTSGNLWNSNLLMYDRRTDSVWSQVLGEAVVGELTGVKLNLIPYDNLLYKEWKAKYPDGEVLSTETGHTRNYQRNPYEAYFSDDRLLFPVDATNNRFAPKEPTYGIEVNSEYKVYAETDLQAGPISFVDELAGVEFNVKYDKLAKTIHFEKVDNGEEIVPTYGFWFSWISVHPDTQIYRSDE